MLLDLFLSNKIFIEFMDMIEAVSMVLGGKMYTNVLADVSVATSYNPPPHHHMEAAFVYVQVLQNLNYQARCHLRP